MSKEAMELALEALDRHQSIIGLTNNKQDVEAIIALRKALADLPVPVQQKPLTDEQIDAAIKLAKKVDAGYVGWIRGQRREFARAIEAAHGIKE